MAEGSVLRRTWLRLGGIATLFRMNTGKGWVSGGGPVKKMPDGSVVVPFARPVAIGFGHPNGDPVLGASDLIGWTVIQITAEMVGKRVAVFTAIEAKREDGGRRTETQKSFLTVINDAGGIAGFADSPEVGEEIIGLYKRTLKA